ncbi:MAG: HNH endonuclease [Lentisphaerae bacterium]|nr:HNH endonuclease [Lentisphaerota bacterium]
MPENQAEPEESLEEHFFLPADEEQVRREREKARQLRASQWWKNLRGQGLCYYCQKRLPPKELCMDHLVPVIRGGKSRKGNIVACCKDCNNKKSHLLPVEWQEYLQQLKERAK